MNLTMHARRSAGAALLATVLVLAHAAAAGPPCPTPVLQDRILSLAQVEELALAMEEELIWQQGKWVRQAEPREGTPEGELALIRRSVDREQYAHAQAQAFLRRYKSTPLREEALNLAGEARLRRGKHWQAYKLFERQLAEFAAGPLMERALYREQELAEAFLAGKKRPALGFIPVPAQDDGLKILEKIAERVPGTPLAETALLTVADYHFNKGKWVEAADGYDQYLKLFPKGERAGYAEYNAAEAFRRAYRGPLFNETPLLEAQHRFAMFGEHYSQEARQRGVSEILEQIRAARARRDLAAGSFYARIKAPEAAAFYYQSVIQNYGDTPAAGQAESLLAGTAVPPPLAPTTTPADVPGGTGLKPVPTTAPATRGRDARDTATATAPAGAKVNP